VLDRGLEGSGKEDVRGVRGEVSSFVYFVLTGREGELAVGGGGVGLLRAELAGLGGEPGAAGGGGKLLYRERGGRRR
jgi:hypothetical protein